MSHRTRYPNLHQLVGDSIDLLSAEVAERVEAVLKEPGDLMSVLQERMEADAATSQAAQRAGLSEPQTGTMAGLRRTVSGISTLTRLMHAAHIARTRGGPLQAVPSETMEGLMVAARELTRHVQQQLQAERMRGAATLQ
ncbi:hypothetical protein [uncultured Stenotrophomonas sp.]|uniref:hypothetical protein n=1 Tax=uncultured Stenotrophomonas sp. TaxID=165438 RepID=UPI0025F8AE90|nr:hypothetical protein [uncultured Stenotrophomonas sp.]